MEASGLRLALIQVEFPLLPEESNHKIPSQPQTSNESKSSKKLRNIPTHYPNMSKNGIAK